MSYTESNLIILMARAAELRAEGQSWGQIALALDAPEATVRGWAGEHPAAWADGLAAARAEIREFSVDAALAALRSLLQCDDLKVKRDAARELLRQAGPRAPAAERRRPPTPWQLDPIPEFDPGSGHPPPLRPAQVPANEPTSDDVPRPPPNPGPTRNSAPPAEKDATGGPRKAKAFNPRAWGLPGAKPSPAAG